MTFDIEKFRNDLHALKETAAQVQKDFSSCGLDIPVAGNEALPYEELLSRVKLQVEKSLQMPERVFQNLLYRVDIPEKNYARLKKASPDFVHDISRLILEREFMKVITRKYYDPGR